MLFKTDSGFHTTLLKEFNTCEVIGAIHGLATDAARGRIYLRELAANRVTALDLRGRKLWHSSTTGQVWATTETELLQLDGAGRPKTVCRFDTPSRQSWMAAF